MSDVVLSAQFFEHNRVQLRRRVDVFPIVIAANGVVQRTADTALPFTQNSNFWYLTGLDTPDALLIISEHEDILVLPERSTVRETFDGTISRDFIFERSGIRTVIGLEEGWKKLSAIAKRTSALSTVTATVPYNTAHGLYSNPALYHFGIRLSSELPDVAVADIRRELSALRSRKKPDEIACIERAVQITKDTLAAVTTQQQLATISYEYELEAAITAAFRRRGATGHAYEPIIAGGHNATTLHYVANNAALVSGAYIVVDVGAEIEHYAADITRTVVKGVASPRQRAVHIAVQAVQRAVIDAIKPGITMKQLQTLSENLIAKQLKQLGLITSTRDTDNISRFYPHAVSHFLGLDVHDVGDYTKPLEPNMVLTCEPGIYIPEESIGVRIEDDIVITEHGCRVL